jgi:OOP family OmpA-OmpF porin
MFKLNKMMMVTALAGAASFGVGVLPAAAQSQPGAQIHSQPGATARPGSVAGQVSGAPYSAVPDVVSQQVQVVYYRPAVSGGNPGAANVYVDGEFHTALLPNGYSVFCVEAGEHTLGAYLNDAPHYKGKTTDLFQVNLEGGKTYFLKVREDGSSGAPVPVARQEAERELAGERAQMHALSRASKVEICKPAAERAAQRAPAAYKDYTLSGDMLFAFGKSGYRDINLEGREAIDRLVEQMRAEDATSRHILVTGHADQIGSAAAAERLGAQRAATVRRLLVERGLSAVQIEAQSAGNTEPVVENCRGSMEQRIACFAPNRRVVVRAEMSRSI